MTYEEICGKRFPIVVEGKNSGKEIILVGLEEVTDYETHYVTKEKIPMTRWVGVCLKKGHDDYVKISLSDLEFPRDKREYTIRKRKETTATRKSALDNANYYKRKGDKRMEKKWRQIAEECKTRKEHGVDEDA